MYSYLNKHSALQAAAASVWRITCCDTSSSGSTSVTPSETSTCQHSSNLRVLCSSWPVTQETTYQLARISSCVPICFCTPHLVYCSTLLQPAANPRHYGHMTSCQFDMSDFCSATDQVHTLKAIKPEDLKLDIALLKTTLFRIPMKSGPIGSSIL